MSDMSQIEHLNGGLCGLVNFGATCYINSLLQSLINNNHLLKNILEKNYTINDTYSNTHLITEIYNLLKGVWSENCLVVPKSFIKALCNIEETDLNNQNDPDEYYEKIICRIYEEICTNNENIEKKEDLDKNEKEWNKHFNNKLCFINNIFYGQYKSETCCLNCNNKTITYNPYISLKLEIVDNNIISCLKSHLSWEHIEYKCEKCNTENKSKKRFTIIKIPDIFVITLKRYNNIKEKNTQNIDFPLYFEIDDKKLELYCIINHFGGNIYCGHYTSYIKYIKNNIWYHMNDNNIEENIDINNIDKSNIYMLFYKKI